MPEIGRFALIIGAMKSGTTSLFEYLAVHPAIAPCSTKEPNFFVDEEQWARGMDAYRRLWDWDAAVHRVALEASTAYSKGSVRDVVRRICEADGEFRFIYIMRDPVDRIASHLSHTATERGGADRVGEAAFRWTLDVSRYATQLDAYLERLPRETILPLVQEAMVANPAAVVDRAVAFLGLEPMTFDPSIVERAHNTRVDWAAGAAATRLLGGRTVDQVRRWAPEPLLRWARAVIGQQNVHRVELTPAQRQHALDVLRPEVARLRDEWGVDVTRWDPALTGANAAGEA